MMRMRSIASLAGLVLVAAVAVAQDGLSPPKSKPVEPGPPPATPSTMTGADEIAIVLSATLPADTQATGICAVRIRLSKEALAAIKEIRVADGWRSRKGPDAMEEEQEPPRSGTKKIAGLVVETDADKAVKAFAGAVLVAKKADLEAALEKDHAAWMKKHPGVKKPFAPSLLLEVGLANEGAVIEWVDQTIALDLGAKKP